MFAKLVGDADLAISRLVQRKLDDDRLDLGRRAVLQDQFAPRQLLQRQLAAGVLKLLEAIETVARVAHHFAGLADIAELPGQLLRPAARPTSADLCIDPPLAPWRCPSRARSSIISRSNSRSRRRW